MTRNLVLAAIIAACFTPAIAHAGDSGDWITPADHSQRSRAEIIYEHANRKITIDSISPSQHSRFEADSFLARLQYALTPDARMDGLVGFFRPSDGDLTPFLGIGLRYNAIDVNPWRLSAYGQLRQSLETRADVSLHDSPRPVPVRYSFTEFELGLLASRRHRIADHAAIIPYAGPMFSILRLSGKRRDDRPGSDRFSADERMMLGAVAGVGLEFYGQHSMRVEFRILDSFNFSAGMAWTF